MGIRFVKMHGLGNDYVYVDCFGQPPPADPAALSRAISDRHCGVGSDGLILICPSEKADARMRMFNADGSEAEMCGNGVRCVAKYVHDHGLKRQPSLTVETGRGVLRLDLEVVHGLVRQVRVDMGEPILDSQRIPTTLTGPRVIDHPLPFGNGLTPEMFGDCGLDPQLSCVSMGNPHAVFYCRDVGRLNLASVGPLLEHLEIFPRRINVHGVQVHSEREVTLRTWERGSGLTMACGTGACAVAVAGVLSGRTARAITAHLPGGELRLDWSEADNHVYMTGPAVEVLQGEWPG